jgi:hypothetical protein
MWNGSEGIKADDLLDPFAHRAQHRVHQRLSRTKCGTREAASFSTDCETREAASFCTECGTGQRASKLICFTPLPTELSTESTSGCEAQNMKPVRPRAFPQNVKLVRLQAQNVERVKGHRS